jgi:hypothetical protein
MIMVHVGNKFALDYRDELVSKAHQSNPPIAYLQGNIEAPYGILRETWSWSFPKTISGFSVVLAYPMVVQQGWVGGLSR